MVMPFGLCDFKAILATGINRVAKIALESHKPKGITVVAKIAYDHINQRT
jgi:hypothetical protein